MEYVSLFTPSPWRVHLVPPATLPDVVKRLVTPAVKNTMWVNSAWPELKYSPWHMHDCWPYISNKLLIATIIISFPLMWE
jgi:hypothetical protein